MYINRKTELYIIAVGNPGGLFIRSNVINIADNACILLKFEQYMYLKNGSGDRSRREEQYYENYI